jgi:hypothetical protein
MIMAVKLPDEEISNLAERTRTKKIGIGYMCKEVSGYCDKEVCRQVKYGAFSNGDNALEKPCDISIDEMEGDERTAFFTINGQVFRIPARDLISYNRLARTAMDQEGIDVGVFGNKKDFHGKGSRSLGRDG